jgi:hypothetical protein
MENNLKFEPSMNDNKIIDDFPSVTKGSVNITKVKRMLNFQPSNLNEAIQDTVTFYNEAYKRFPNERKRNEEKLIKRLAKREEDKHNFEIFIKKMSE